MVLSSLIVASRCSSTLTPQSSVSMFARAVSAWSATSETHLNLSSDVGGTLLSLSQGDVVTVLQQRDDWWLGQRNGTQGWFPKSSVALEAAGNIEYEDTHEKTHVFLELNLSLSLDLIQYLLFQL